MRAAVTAFVAMVLATSALAGGAVAAQDDHEGFVVDGDQLVLHNGPGQQVTGQTTLEPGTVVQVKIQSASGKHPFLTRPEAVVRDDGTFTANFSLDSLDATMTVELTATVASTGETIDAATADVRPCNGACPDETIPSGPDEERSDADEVRGGDLLARDVVTVEQGDTARIPVVLDGESAVTLVVGGSDVNYQIGASVSDGNGDGRVDVLFNTTAAGHVPPTLSVGDDADSLTVTDDEDWLGWMLESVAYDLRLYRGEPTGDPDTVGTLAVRDGDHEELPDDPAFSGERPRSFGFEEDIVMTYRGEETALNLSLVDAETATVTVSNDQYGFAAEATVRDGDGDGRVPLAFDTAVGTTDRPFRATQDGDAVVDVSMTRGNVTGALPPEQFQLGIYRGEQATGDPDAVGALAVQEFPEGQPPGQDSPATETGSATAETSDEASETGAASETASSTPADDAVLVGGGALGLLVAFGVATRLFT